MIKKFERIITNTQSKFKANMEKKDITQQCSYNLPNDIESYLKSVNAIVRETPIGSEMNVLYKLTSDYSLKLGCNIFAIIGEEYKTKTNKAVFTHTEGPTGGSSKMQLKKTDFASKGDNYKWFVDLYNLNIEGVNFVTYVDDVSKTITFDVELTRELFSSHTAEDDDDCNDVLNHSLYGIHIKKMNDALSNTSPHICIGWSELGDLSAITTRTDLESLYETTWPGCKPKAKGQDVGQIWRFINEAQIGDYVIFAESTLCHIGRIETDYIYDGVSRPDQDSDYVNNRKVTWLKKDITRSSLSDTMHRSLMTSMSFFRINDYRSAVVSLLDGTYEKDELEATEEVEISDKIIYVSGYKTNYSRNRILFGAPGTGKSFQLNDDSQKLILSGGEIERVTFHPNYSYANFVGTYKPVPSKDKDGNDAITYEYVPGPFMRTYVKALQSARTSGPKPYLLLIEEINRSEVAAVFGEVFQLLDRDDDETSLYPVHASEDIKKYLAKSENLGGKSEDYTILRIPDNMFIWASMNSADQGVFPMDTAFKRRWEFNYIGINEIESKIKGKYIILGTGTYERTVEWNELRKAINDFLSNTLKINEDKLIGPYFIARKIIENGINNDSGKFIIDKDTFTSVFKGKVLMYLFEDAAKQKRNTLFGVLKDANKYSDICQKFDDLGVFIFAKDISDKFPKEGDAE